VDLIDIEPATECDFRVSLADTVRMQY